GEDRSRLEQFRELYLKDRRLLLSPDTFLNHNTDGVGNPLARAYSRSEAARLFARFNKVRTEAHFLNKRWIPLLGRLMPRAVERRLAALAGWHLWIIAEK
ncbi:MAG TPA: hypothetical protein VNO14_04655, partial [Blastocatellia bacterium]|nr:hypothetical protein [Blastocatellia bacterium]